MKFFKIRIMRLSGNRETLHIGAKDQADAEKYANQLRATRGYGIVWVREEV